MLSIWDRMLDDMQLAGFADRTQSTYLSAARRLADHAHKPPDQISEDDLRHYFLYLRNERKLSRSSLTIALCSIKFLFERTLRRDWPTLAIIRPPKEHKLPAVLSQTEVQDVLRGIHVARYRICLSVIYACGLRITEGVSLTVPQIVTVRPIMSRDRPAKLYQAGSAK